MVKKYTEPTVDLARTVLCMHLTQSVLCSSSAVGDTSQQGCISTDATQISTTHTFTLICTAIAECNLMVYRSNSSHVKQYNIDKLPTFHILLKQMNMIPLIPKI